MSFTLNPIQRIANNAMKSSRQIRLCRRAYSRARARRDKKFWYDWEYLHQQKMINQANILIRIRSITR